MRLLREKISQVLYWLAGRIDAFAEATRTGVSGVSKGVYWLARRVEPTVYDPFAEPGQDTAIPHKGKIQ